MLYLKAMDQKTCPPWMMRSRRCPSAAPVENAPPSDLAIVADEHGSPVTADPEDWIVCFVPGLIPQWWHRFVHHKHKHVFAMRPTPNGSWLLVEPWWTRMMVTVLSPADAVKFLRWGGAGDMLRVREAIPGTASQFRGWSNCAVLTAYVLGRSSRTWTPHGLYRELAREPGVSSISVEQLLVAQFREMAGHYSFRSPAFSADEPSLPLDDVLFLVGRNLLEAALSPALLELYRIALVEGRRYPELARAFAADGPGCAILWLTGILEKADLNGEVELENCEAGARQFLGMLFGMQHLDAVLLSGAVPARSDIDMRARMAVDVFLSGVSVVRRRSSAAPRRRSAFCHANV